MTAEHEELARRLEATAKVGYLPDQDQLAVEEAASTICRLSRDLEEASQRLTQRLACIQIIANGDEPNMVADFPAAEDVRRLRSRLERQTQELVDDAVYRDRTPTAPSSPATPERKP